VFYNDNKKDRIVDTTRLNKEIFSNINSQDGIDEIWQRVIMYDFDGDPENQCKQDVTKIFHKLYDEIKEDWENQINPKGENIAKKAPSEDYYKTINHWFNDLDRHVFDIKTPLLSRDGVIEIFKSMYEKYRYFGVIFLDVSCFKVFNDVLDHDTGDVYLEAVGKIIKDETAKTEFYLNPNNNGELIKCDGMCAGRDGGDEFYILIGLDDHIEYIRDICRTISLNIYNAILKNLQTENYRKLIIPRLKELSEPGFVKTKKWQKGLEVITGVPSPYDDDPVTDGEGLGFIYTTRTSDATTGGEQTEYISVNTIGRLKFHPRVFSKEQFAAAFAIAKEEKLRKFREENPLILENTAVEILNTKHEAEQRYIVAAKLAESVKFNDNKIGEMEGLVEDIDSEEFKMQIKKIFSD
jgi:GGDEF domain-containing protein